LGPGGEKQKGRGVGKGNEKNGDGGKTQKKRKKTCYQVNFGRSKAKNDLEYHKVTEGKKGGGMPKRWFRKGTSS